MVCVCVCLSLSVCAQAYYILDELIIAGKCS